jgi:PAS domain S-box-containing protein
MIDKKDKIPLTESELRKELAQKEKQIDKLLQEVRRYELAASGANDGLWDWDLITNEAFTSTPWKSMLGYSEDDVETKIGEWEKLLHPDDKEKTTKALKDYIEGKTEKYEQEFRMLHKNGNYIWVSSRGTVLRDPMGNPYRISGSHTDITDRKMSETLLKENERKYRNLFENSMVGIIRAKMSTGEVLEANAKFLSLTGLIFSEINTFFLQDLFVNEDRRREVARALYQKNQVENKEIELRKGNGESFWVLFSAKYSKEEDLMECIINDISQLKSAITELEKVNFELDNFVYHSSHDLRSPLRSIIGLVNLIKTEKDPSMIQKCLEMIEGSVIRLDHLVVDLLSFSKNSRTEISTVPINFQIEVNNSITNFYSKEECKNLLIKTVIQNNIPFISDLTRIRIILNNLISNAIKYRDSEKEISVIQIVIKVNEKEVSIEIEDNGEGVLPEKIDGIFDMFVRASESSEGSGLGLYIVKNVLEKLGGEISVASEYKKGTKFSLRIPNMLTKQINVIQHP